MLSAARRADARRGLGGMEEENEFEEGEAYSGQEDGRCIDPDALSYIDKKIQDVLGHFQKDFEAGVSAENLGAKFGGYGSFLPTYQRSPSILGHPRSPHKVGNQNVSKSPSNMSVEVTNQNTSVMLNLSFPKSNPTAVPLMDNSCKRDISMNKPNTQDPSSLRTPSSKTADGSDHKTLKLRIKVGPDNNLARNNAAIYSGLGLDISPSSSSEESPDGSNGNFPEPHDTSDESPRTILQVMTSFPIPGVNLLSPLHDCLFHSIEKDIPLNKPYKQGKLSKERSETTSGFIDLSIHSRESNGQPEKPTKLSQQNGRSKGAKYLEDKGAVILNREIDLEARPVQELTSDSFGRVSSYPKNTKKAEGQIGENTIGTKTLDCPLDIKKDSSKDKPITGPTKDRQFELVNSTIDNGVGYSANRINQSKGKLSEKTITTEKALEDLNANIQKNGKSDLQREARVKIDKDYEIPSADLSGEKRRNEQVAEAADHTKQSSSPFKDMVLQRKDQLSDKKSKVITSQSDSGEVVKASVCGSLATALNEKKKNLEKKSKGQKSLKYPSGSCAKESYGNSNWAVKNEENGVGSSNNLKVKNKAMKRKEEESTLPSQPFKERSGGKKMGNTLALGTSVGEPVPMPLTCNNPAADATIVPQASIIEENWVQCDICQKWRLLPYGTNPGHLPSKWQCNLLNWLPGMNSCHFSEDDTTNALHASYIAPALENVASLDGFGHSVASTSLASGVHFGVPTIKKKSFQDALMLNQSISTEFPIAVKKDDQISVNDANQYLPTEINSSNKGTIGTLGRSADSRTEKHKAKQKDKHKNHGFYRNGGNHSEKNEKHSKAKGKRMIDQDDFISPKKHKKEILQSLKYDIKGNPSPSSNKVRDDVQFFNNGQIKEHLSTSDVEKSLSTKKKLMRHENQYNQKGFMTSQNEDNRVNIKEIFSESECVQDKKAELLMSEAKTSKTNNLNNRMEKKKTTSRTILDAKGDYIPNDMDEEATNLVEKECPSRQSQENEAFSRDLDFGSLRRDSTKTRGTNSVQPSLAANSSSSKVSGSQKSRSNLPEPKGSPVESVSSSPLRIPTMEKQSRKKVSDKKYDTNTDYSVLRSPKRCLDVGVDGRNKPAKRRKDMASSFQKQSIEDNKAASSAILDSLGGTVDYLEKERTRSTVTKYEEKLLVKQSVHDKFLPIENGNNPYKDDYEDIKKVNRQLQVVDPTHRTYGKSSSGFKEKYRDSKSDSDKSRLKASCSHSDNKDLNSASNARSYRLEVTTDSCRNENDDTHDKYVKDCSLKKGHSSRWTTSKADNSLTFALQDNVDTNGPSVLSNQQRNLDAKNSVTGARSLKPEFPVSPLEHEKTVNQNGSHKTHIPDILSGQEKSQFKLASGDKQETHAPDIVSSPLKQRRSDGEMVDAVNTDASKVGKQLKHPDNRAGLHHTRHALPSGPDTSSPSRKENHSLLIKEARDLKHTANRLKIEGRELESTSLFFEAALKFLHIASLIEPSTFDSAKLAEAALMYFETAKLCEFVARECEKIKDMASAALAYKCIEVAYLKAAYCKNPNASRDRHELQAAFQFLPSGESPSSSASDVDNLNNQALLAKNASTKGVSSPQVASHHILAARHHFQVMRLLHYTNDLNCAFEATRKSQISIAAAGSNLDKDRPDTLSSVRKALDFNFHDVEGLLRLVRISLESIGH